MEETEQVARWRPTRSLYPMIVLLSLILSILMVASVIVAVYLIKLYAIYVLYAWLIALAILPGIGVGFLVAMLWRYIHKPQIIPVHERGTIVRVPDGNLQVISGSELFAFETRAAAPIVDAPLAIEEYSSYSANSTFPVGNVSDITPVYVPRETFPPIEPLQKNPLADAIDFLEDEQVASKVQEEQLHEQNVIDRIARLHSQGLPLRAISRIVGMQGRKYARFKELCALAGIENVD